MPIVIVDDSPVNLMLMDGLARHATGLDVATFDDPVTAVVQIPGLDPDIVLIDYMMPGLNGLEMIQRLRADRSLIDTPLVMVTTVDQRDVRLAALEAGATDFLTKPIDAAEFKVGLRNLVALKAASRIIRNRAEDLAREVARATSDLHDREQEIILRLSRAAEYRDPETGAHVQRMAEYCRLIAEGMGCDQAFTADLWRAAPMHDVGKIGVPEDMLNKPGALTPEERAEVERHTRYGADILRGSKSPLIKLAHEIASTHHERWDGTGYPLGLKGRAIPLSGRIVAVADVFDALTSARPYKDAWPILKARGYIVEQAGKHFDPECVHGFLLKWDDVSRIHDAFKDSSGAVHAA